mmetsp:Transcript_31112/g.85198  ORF Transcript_31112/g.85198 Transcript_31112/m.85198 type:complete len:261 (+) Transcript_31112:217-999(+)
MLANRAGGRMSVRGGGVLALAGTERGLVVSTRPMAPLLPATTRGVRGVAQPGTMPPSPTPASAGGSQRGAVTEPPPTRGTTCGRDGAADDRGVDETAFHWGARGVNGIACGAGTDGVAVVAAACATGSAADKTPGPLGGGNTKGLARLGPDLAACCSAAAVGDGDAVRACSACALGRGDAVRACNLAALGERDAVCSCGAVLQGKWDAADACNEAALGERDAVRACGVAPQGKWDNAGACNEAVLGERDAICACGAVLPG